MLFATVILLVGLVAIAQLVPASIFLNYQNRNNSSALVFAQRELDQMLDRPLTFTVFTNAEGQLCQLGDPAISNAAQGTNVVTYQNQAAIDFNTFIDDSFLKKAAAIPSQLDMTQIPK